MPVNLQKLKTVEKELYFYIGEDEVPDDLIHFVYRPNEFTPALEERFRTASDAELVTDEYLKIICTLVVSWDVYDKPEEEGGKPVPFMIEPSEEEGEFLVNTKPGLRPNLLGLKQIPSQIFAKLLKKISEDQNPKKEEATGLQIG